MRSRTKSILALCGTLVLGMVLGGLIASQVFRARINHFRELRQKRHFSNRIIDVTQASPEQQKAIQPILEDYGQQMEAMHRHHLEEVKSAHQKLRTALGEHLNAEQMAALDKEFRRMTGRAKRMLRHNGGPPHGKHRKKSRDGE